MKIFKQNSAALKPPPFRKLRGYAFDPSLSLKHDTASINNIVYKISWENVGIGPVGEYLEVIDYDPTINQFYLPVDLDAKYILAQDGLDPSESNPQFHQQMVYAVAMTTIKNFEKGLGRKILWSPRRVSDQKIYEEYVSQLRIYPHALREANAFYSPVKKALLFGYFSSTPADETILMPDSLVFTCLSHDIVAHETTHAILDGMHNYYNEPTNADVLAFHEAFADIVALFQHFTFPEVLRHQIAKTRGNLGLQNLLGQLAQQFGTAIGDYGSLRDAIGDIDVVTKQWKPLIPDPNDYRTIMEPHKRGSILVAAVFEAFLSIYKNRITDLLRIASDGTGILQQGELHPDLINRLASEAAKTASHALNMCIRALDYCPPVDITFGDYLRAIITADADLVEDDVLNYRLAFIDAFRRRGIYPDGIKTLSIESLCYPLLNIGNATDADGNTIELDENSSQKLDPETNQLMGIINGFLREYSDKIKYINDREQIYTLTKKYISGYHDETTQILGLHNRINVKFNASLDFSLITGLAFFENFNSLGVRQSTRYGGPSFEIQNLRVVSKVGPKNTQINQVVFSILQRCGVTFENGAFKEFYIPPLSTSQGKQESAPEGSFEFRGGCTLIFDLDTLKLKYAISKPLIDKNSLLGNNKNRSPKINIKRLEAQYKYLNDENNFGINEYVQYFGTGLHSLTEPFAFLHQH